MFSFNWKIFEVEVIFIEGFREMILIVLFISFIVRKRDFCFLGGILVKFM